MADANKVPLVKQGMRLLVNQLTARDRVAIRRVRQHAKVVLPSTRATITRRSSKPSIASKPTARQRREGIQWAVPASHGKLHRRRRQPRHPLPPTAISTSASPTSGPRALIEQQARSGRVLSVFGFGMGNLRIRRCKSSPTSNGHYRLHHDLDEARKMFVDPDAQHAGHRRQDAKLQVEFNPAWSTPTAHWLRETDVAPEDFNNDAKMPATSGRPHRHALYEIVPAGAPLEPGVDPLNTGPRRAARPAPTDDRQAPLQRT